ncbi:GDP-mannose 6-dehydrogenase [compost metagenome]
MSSLLHPDLDQVIRNADVIVLGNGDEQFRPLLERELPGKRVLDLVGFMNGGSDGPREGICW